MNNIPFIDHAKGAAIFFVVLLHTAAPLVMKFELGSTTWWIGHFYDSISRWGVPVFVMATGALLIKKGDSTNVFYRKRFSRIAIPLIIWSVFFSCWAILKEMAKGNEWEFGSLLFNLLTGTTYYHLWYIYMLVGLYLFAPFIVNCINGLNSRNLRLLIFISFFISAGHWFSEYVSGSERSKFFLSWFASYIPYFLVGYYLTSYKLNLARPKIYFVFTLSIIVTIFSLYITSVTFDRQAGYYFYTNLSITVILMSLSIFLIFKDAGKLFFLAAIFKKLSGLSLGIYFVHPIFLDLFYYVFSYPSGMSALFLVPIYAVSAVIFSVIVCSLFSKIPILKRCV